MDERLRNIEKIARLEQERGRLIAAVRYASRWLPEGTGGKPLRAVRDIVWPES